MRKRSERNQNRKCSGRNLKKHKRVTFRRFSLRLRRKLIIVVAELVGSYGFVLRGVGSPQEEKKKKHQKKNKKKKKHEKKPTPVFSPPGMAKAETAVITPVCMLFPPFGEAVEFTSEKDSLSSTETLSSSTFNVGIEKEKTELIDI